MFSQIKEEVRQVRSKIYRLINKLQTERNIRRRRKGKLKGMSSNLFSTNDNISLIRLNNNHLYNNNNNNNNNYTNDINKNKTTKHKNNKKTNNNKKKPPIHIFIICNPTDSNKKITFGFPEEVGKYLDNFPSSLTVDDFKIIIANRKETKDYYISQLFTCLLDGNDEMGKLVHRNQILIMTDDEFNRLKAKSKVKIDDSIKRKIKESLSEPCSSFKFQKININSNSVNHILKYLENFKNNNINITLPNIMNNINDNNNNTNNNNNNNIDNIIDHKKDNKKNNKNNNNTKKRERDESFFNQAQIENDLKHSFDPPSPITLDDDETDNNGLPNKEHIITETPLLVPFAPRVKFRDGENGRDFDGGDLLNQYSSQTKMYNTFLSNLIEKLSSK